jgi:hypothetical protein
VTRLSSFWRIFEVYAGNNGRSLPVDEVKSGSNDNNIVLKFSRKRNLIPSPEKCISSPNKRQRISLKGDHIESPKIELPVSFSLHSHILTRNFSNSSEGVLSFLVEGETIVEPSSDCTIFVQGLLIVETVSSLYW